MSAMRTIVVQGTYLGCTAALLLDASTLYGFGVNRRTEIFWRKSHHIRICFRSQLAVHIVGLDISG